MNEIDCHFRYYFMKRKTILVFLRTEDKIMDVLLSLIFKSFPLVIIQRPTCPESFQAPLTCKLLLDILHLQHTNLTSCESQTSCFHDYYCKYYHLY